MDYLDEAQLRSLLSILIRRTDNDSISWATKGSDYDFRAQGKKYSYSIGSVDRDDYAPYRFEIAIGDPENPFDPDAKLLQVAISSNISAVNEELAELYEVVKRSTLDLDAIAHEILADFDEEVDNGE